MVRASAATQSRKVDRAVSPSSPQASAAVSRAGTVEPASRPPMPLVRRAHCSSDNANSDMAVTPASREPSGSATYLLECNAGSGAAPGRRLAS